MKNKNISSSANCNYYLTVLTLCIIMLGNIPTTFANDKVVNLKVRPVQFLMLFTNIEAEIKITNKLTIGPTIYYRNIDHYVDGREGEKYTNKLISYGINGYYYFNDAFKKGWFLSPFFHYAKFFTNYYSSAGSPKKLVQSKFEIANYPIVGLTAGYQWFSKTGYNLAIEGGGLYGTPYVGALPVLTLSLGKAF